MVMGRRVAGTFVWLVVATTIASGTSSEDPFIWQQPDVSDMRHCAAYKQIMFLPCAMHFAPAFCNLKQAVNSRGSEWATTLTWLSRTLIDAPSGLPALHLPLGTQQFSRVQR